MKTESGLQKTSFKESVYAIVRKIPKGKTLSYNDVAHMLETSPRAVGQALKRNPYKNVPCHRVIHSDGRIGGYFGMPCSKEKIKKLEDEGIRIRDGIKIK